jgi:hypothetical protein
MSTFLTIPLEDILLFLKENNLKIPRTATASPKSDRFRTNKATYNLAWETLSSGGELVISSLAIEDFILAYNSQGSLDKSYKTSTLLISSDEQLRDLSNLVGLSIIRRDRLIRILGYLGLLVNDVSTFDTLPKDALWIIGSNLDCRSIGTFRVISKRFAELFNEKEITDMIRASLHRATSRNLTTYTRNDLDTLCSFEQNKGRLARGFDFSLVIFNPNKVCAWGRNDHGQLGTGKTSARVTTKPKIIPGLKNIKAVAAGYSHSLALDFRGQVYSWGNNIKGQLGLGHYLNIKVPTLIPGLKDIMAIFAGSWSSIALDNKGRGYHFGVILIGGHEMRGLPILSPPISPNIPRLIEDIDDIISVSIEHRYILFLNREGMVYGTGDNYHRVLGFVDNGSISSMTQINHLENIVAITATATHSFFLNTEGEILVLGEIRPEISEDEYTIAPIKLLGMDRVMSIQPSVTNFIIVDYRGNLFYPRYSYNGIIDEKALEEIEEKKLDQGDIIALAHYPGGEFTVITKQGELLQLTFYDSTIIGKVEVY